MRISTGQTTDFAMCKAFTLHVFVQLQITKFVIAPQSSDEADQIHCEADDLDVDLEGMDHVNEDSLVTDESTDEHRELAVTTEEEEPLYDPADVTGDEESQEQEVSVAAQPEVSWRLLQRTVV